MKLLLFSLLAIAAGPCLADEQSPLMGAFVRSDQWQVRREPHKVEELTGHVSYRRGDGNVFAHWALYDHSTELVKARGHIVAQQKLASGDEIFARGERAEHDLKSKRGFLIGANDRDSVKFSRRIPNSSAQDSGTALRMSWDEGKQTALLTGDAHFVGPEGECWAENMRYDMVERSLTLTGRRPVAKAQDVKWIGAVQADTIIAFRSPKEVRGEGQAQGWFLFREKSPFARKNHKWN